METCSQNYLELLPLELRQQILASLPDVDTLRTAVLSCPALYYAFHESPISTITSVLSSEIGPAVLPEAAMVLEASSISHRILSDPDMTYTILQKHWLQREKVRWKWTLTDALAISNLHCYVHSFAMKFSSTALLKMENLFCGQQSAYFPPTQRELERIERAFYRFGIYCNLFPLKLFEGTSSYYRVEMLKGFFSKFAPWENEQLVCIHHFLIGEVIPANRNNSTMHDSWYGHSWRSYRDELGYHQIKEILSHGLQRLYDIATCRYLWRHTFYGDAIQDSVETFIYGPLTYLARDLEDTARLEEYTKGHEWTPVRQPFFDDPNTGPEKAWRLACVKELIEDDAGLKYSGPLRGLGYVFWDLERLIASGIWQGCWEDPDFSDYAVPSPVHD